MYVWFEFVGALVLATISTVCSMNDTSTDQSRQPRHVLLFPKNCILQLAIGVAVPTTFSYHKMATNGGIMLNVELPDNLTQFAHPPYARTQKVNHHDLLRIIHDLSGMDGHSCIQKSICQLKEVPFQKVGNIYEQLLHILFVSDHANTTDSNCHMNFPLCPVSMVDFLTEIYET